MMKKKHGMISQVSFFFFALSKKLKLINFKNSKSPKAHAYVLNKNIHIPNNI